jgi:hypothetical protein
MAKKDVTMNVELQKWVEETKDEIKLSKKGKGKAKQKPRGMCHLCGERSAKAVCIKCGKSVCLSCYFKIIGVCKKCVPKEISGKWDGSHPDWEKELGVEWIG